MHTLCESPFILVLRLLRCQVTSSLCTLPLLVMYTHQLLMLTVNNNKILNGMGTIPSHHNHNNIIMSDYLNPEYMSVAIVTCMYINNCDIILLLHRHYCIPIMQLGIITFNVYNISYTVLYINVYTNVFKIH